MVIAARLGTYGQHQLTDTDMQKLACSGNHQLLVDVGTLKHTRLVVLSVRHARTLSSGYEVEKTLADLIGQVPSASVPGI
ncbi:hypothetical protein CDL15_Pgr012541 [Punica granatum]|uniref:Uncharacterized protein n=1 Tax=Punica granatum TaxID=22663 RepID=A0A218XY46_PUNGR|nr:hypothetical protein CDL15_Pgr012541 [Punica granatum]